MLRHPGRNQLNRLVNLIVRLIFNYVCDGVKIILQWIPSHKGIVGNDVVDQVAKNASMYNTLTTFPFEYNDLVKLVNKRLYMFNLEYWNQVKDDLFYSKSVLDISQWEWFSLNDRFYDVLLARFRSGDAGLNSDLFRIRQVDNPNCLTCGVRENVNHFIFRCGNYNVQRRLLFQDLRQVGIQENMVNLNLLLTGGNMTGRMRVKVMQIFVQFIKKTGRFN